MANIFYNNFSSFSFSFSLLEIFSSAEICATESFKLSYKTEAVCIRMKRRKKITDRMSGFFSLSLLSRSSLLCAALWRFVVLENMANDVYAVYFFLLSEKSTFCEAEAAAAAPLSFPFLLCVHRTHRLQTKFHYCCCYFHSHALSLALSLLSKHTHTHISSSSRYFAATLWEKYWKVFPYARLSLSLILSLLSTLLEDDDEDDAFPQIKYTQFLSGTATVYSAMYWGNFHERARGCTNAREK